MTINIFFVFVYFLPGPTCGLVALCMLVNGAPSDLLNLARKKMFTKNGEMFSASNLFELAKTAIQCNGINVKLFDGKLNCAEIKQVLKSGGCLLVPYPFTLAKFSYCF